MWVEGEIHGARQSQGESIMYIIKKRFLNNSKSQNTLLNLSDHEFCYKNQITVTEIELLIASHLLDNIKDFFVSVEP